MRLPTLDLMEIARKVRLCAIALKSERFSEALAMTKRIGCGLAALTRVYEAKGHWRP